MARPATGDYAPFYHNYVEMAKGYSVKELIESYALPLNNFFQSLPDEKADYAYAEGKWTIKDLVQHIIDAERIFAYRALRFSRKDQTNLPGFDENAFAEHAHASERTFASLKEEFVAVRKSTDLLLQSFSEEQLLLSGLGNNNAITVNAICFIIYGHILHHKKILEERYLN
ncbi:MAG: DinB family protein [Sphingobacteriia bacterium]|nr:DinB family protein [Sphingobacteriia bacterium]